MIVLINILQQDCSSALNSSPVTLPWSKPQHFHISQHLFLKQTAMMLNV